MSGLELVGVILAVPPLAVTWLEHYRTVFETYRCWRKYREQYRKFQSQVDMLKCSIDLTLEALLLPYVGTPEELDRLREAPNDESWIEIESKLQKRLGQRVRKIFLANLADLREAVKDIDHAVSDETTQLSTGLALANQDDAKSHQRPPNRFKKLTASAQNFVTFEIERAKFSTRTGPRDSAFEKAKTQLELIRNLVTHNDEVAEIRSRELKKLTNRNLGYLTKFWRHAHLVYELITKSWRCACQTDHCANVRLHQHQGPEVYMDVDFFFDHAMSSAQNVLWNRTRTRISRNEPDPPVPRTRVVSFATNPAIQQQPMNPSAAQDGSSTSQVTKPPKIDDLCHTIISSSAANSCLGTLVGQPDHDQYTVLVATTPGGHNTPSDFTSLQSLLTDNSPNKPDRKQRFAIALSVVASHLQLHSSAWLEHGWSSENLIFEKSDQGCRFEQPYLRRSFTPTHHACPQGALDIPFVSLGVLLLELCFGTTLDQSPFRAQHCSPDGSKDFVQDREAAWEWAKMVVGETGQDYYDVVDWCLNRWRMRTTDESSDKKWREQYYRIVVETLQKVYTSTWPPEEIDGAGS